MAVEPKERVHANDPVDVNDPAYRDPADPAYRDPADPAYRDPKVTTDRTEDHGGTNWMKWLGYAVLALLALWLLFMLLPDGDEEVVGTSDPLVIEEETNAVIVDEDPNVVTEEVPIQPVQ